MQFADARHRRRHHYGPRCHHTFSPVAPSPLPRHTVATIISITTAPLTTPSFADRAADHATRRHNRNADFDLEI